MHSRLLIIPFGDGSHSALKPAMTRELKMLIILSRQITAEECKSDLTADTEMMCSAMGMSEDLKRLLHRITHDEEIHLMRKRLSRMGFGPSMLSLLQVM